MAMILLACGPCVIIVNCWDRFCTLGRAPHTKETLPDFHEWCWVTRHPRIFRGLTDCQRDTPVLERHKKGLGPGCAPPPYERILWFFSAGVQCVGKLGLGLK